MTTAIALPAEALVELAHLTHLEYRARVLLDAAFRTLDALADDEVTEDDRRWRDSLYQTWTGAWGELATLRRELGMAA